VRIRPLIVLSAVALTGALLAGCSGPTDASPSGSPSATATADLCAAAAKPGTASDEVKLDGKAGTEPTVTFTSPLEVTEIQRTVATEGSGDKIANGDLVQYGIVAYDAETGKKLGSAGYEAGSALPIQVSAEGAGQFFGCATIGSRIVLALPGSEGAAAQINVVDVLGVTPTAAWGKEQAPKAGLPTVKLAKDGTPTITIPDTKAPTGLEIEVLKQGDGPTVAEGDQVLTQYTGVSWDTKKNFDSSWSRGAPAAFATNQVYEGFGKALVGQKVGSQVLVVMPPAMGDLSGELKGQTLVFVIDILATQHGAAQ
jgi:peptidylprolyl isomerase